MAASSSASDPIGGSASAVCDSQAAIKSVPPVVRSASLPRHYLGRLELNSMKIDGLNENERDKLVLD